MSSFGEIGVAIQYQTIDFLQNEANPFSDFSQYLHAIDVGDLHLSVCSSGKLRVAKI
jgi:hypothetical protein